MKKVVLLLTVLLTISGCSNHDIFSSDPVNSASNGTSISYQGETSFKEHIFSEANKTYNTNRTAVLDEDYVSSLQLFAKDFYKAVEANYSSDNNHVFSPVSLATCYSMLLDGACNNSKKELEKLLHYDDSFSHLDEIQKMLLKYAIDDEERSTYLDINQSFWMDNDSAPYIKRAYVNKLNTYYFADSFKGTLDSEEMHVALADYINYKTRGFLEVKKEDFEDYGGLLWLLNTIYLKAPWQNQFSEFENEESAFKNRDGTSLQVTFMNSAFRSSYFKASNYVISSLPLSYGLRFNILLPNSDVTYPGPLFNEDAISNLLNYENLTAVLTTTISYKVPQFKSIDGFDLVDLFRKMGVSDIFTPGVADLSDIGGRASHVSKSKHVAGIDVNNEGIEAAAYTIIEVEKIAMPEQPKMEFNVDHPFAYTISSADGIPLFMGVVTNLK